MDKTFDSRAAQWLAAPSVRGQSAKGLGKLPTPLVAILGPALGGAFLIPHPWIGALLWLAVFQNLRYAAFALLGVAIAEGISRGFRIRDTAPIEGSLKANAVLAAIASAWLTGLTGISLEAQLTVAVVSAVAATIISAAAIKALAGANLPSLVLSYCFVAAMLFAIFPHWTYAATISMVWWPVPTDLLGWVVTFFRTLGALLFSPTLTVGLVIAAAVLLWSRVAFAAGVIGWIAGIIAATALSQEGVVYYWMPTAYNFFLAGSALGAVFFLPGRSSMITAAIGGCSASFIAAGLQHLFPGTALGYLPIASALTIWIAIYALGLTDDQMVARRNLVTDIPPETAWWRAAYWARRSGTQGPFMVVPINGPTQVGQGADGLLSHVGPWRYALDFQHPDLPGRPRRRAADGAASWNPPVITPAGGIIERVRDGVADNPLGICNFAESWGNYVIIRLDQGNFALLAHLQRGSIAVKPGMRVEIGTRLGAVGNSGRSPIPHLHLQVQNSPEPGAPTVPFRLANFLSATDVEKPLLQWHSVALPDQGAIVAPALPNPVTHSIVTSTAPSAAVWDVESKGLIPRPFREGHAVTTRVVISFDAAGRHLFKGSTGGALVASLDPDAWRIVELEAGASPLLKLLALAVPSIPYAAFAGMIWEEPAPLVALGIARWLALPLSPYLAEPFAQVRCQCISAPDEPNGPLVIETQLETGWSWLPSKLTCQFSRLRGPVRLEAAFPSGTVTYSLLSFEPGLPFGSGVA
jgi:hypothetical protein